MSDIVTDAEIERLLQVEKPLQPNWRRRLDLLDSKDRQGFRRREMKVQSVGGDEFEVKCRQSVINPMDFSVILLWNRPNGEQFRLLRCNGPHPSQHTNKIEKEEGKPNACFEECCHVHRATERYQLRSWKEDDFAEPTRGYADYEEALLFFMKIANFVDSEDDESLPLFEGECNT